MITFDQNDEDLTLTDIFIMMKKLQKLQKLKEVRFVFKNIYPNDNFQKIFL